MAERLEAISLPEAEPDPPAFEKQNVDEPVFLRPVSVGLQQEGVVEFLDQFLFWGRHDHF